MTDNPHIPTLAARWLRWVASTSARRNPVSDESGRNAAWNQPRDLWFVAGNFGGVTKRRFQVPAGRPLFMPAFCMWSPRSLTIEDIPRSFGHVVVDGVDVDVVPASSRPVTIRGAFRNPATGSLFPATRHITGHWAHVPRLSPGEHLLQIDGGDGNGWTTSVTAHVTAG